MPKQNDEPVSVSQTLTEQDYDKATAAVRYFSAPMRRRSIRASICLTAAALAAAFIPVCGKNLTARNAVVAAAILFAAAAVAIWLIQPAAEKNSAGKWFRSCPLAALPETVTISRDRAVIQNECERTTEYWTDFTLCIEMDSLIVAAGGQERFLLVMK